MCETCHMPISEHRLEAEPHGWFDCEWHGGDCGSWTRLNRQRYADTEAAGLMTDAGRRAADVARQNGWWTIYDSVEDLTEPDELAQALNSNARARSAWDGFPPSARKMMLWWVISAAREDTRAKRIATIVAKSAKGERARG